MASQNPQTHPGGTKGKPFPLGSYLFTPPEHTADSFSCEVDERAHTVDATQNKLPPFQSRTPPASPAAIILPDIATATGLPAHDSPLFAEQARDRARSQTPLFEDDQSQSPLRSRVAPVVASGRTEFGRPKPSHAYAYPANLNIRTANDAMQYYNDRMDELNRLKEHKLPTPQAAHGDRDWLSTHQLNRLPSVDSSKPTGVVKTRASPRPAARPKTTIATSPEKTSPPKRRTPKPRTYNDFVDSAFPQAQTAAKHKRASPSKKVEGENVSWTELPDFAPPTSTLDSGSKPLKASWTGNAIDLSADPDKSYCHTQELAVAATLRLSCAQFLTNKRKIFQARLQALKDGKNFTKTAAQGACAIDVNKASQLWEAFDRVGWFKETWFQQHL